jgi:hypothetical protein
LDGNVSGDGEIGRIFFLIIIFVNVFLFAAAWNVS